MAAGAAAGRHVVVYEKANNAVYKNVKLLGSQDTYYTKGTKTYWEGGEIHGTTDFICGNGDVFFNKVLLWVDKVSAMTAASTTTPWGYVFKDCTIDGSVSGFNLGRSWSTARTVFLNTTMKKLPSDGGWGTPIHGSSDAAKLFAEYKSVTANGADVNTSKRINGGTVLSDAEAAKYTISGVLGPWQPDALTKQIAAPIVTRDGSLFKWNDDANALCWAVFKNGKFLESVTTNSYTASSLAASDVITVRAANEMGGLGPSSGSTSSIVGSNGSSLRHEIRDGGRSIFIHGQNLSNLSATLHRADGTRVYGMRLSIDPDATTARLAIESPETGVRVLRYGNGAARWSGPVILGGSSHASNNGASE